MEAKREAIVGFLKAGKSPTEISSLLNCSRMAVYRAQKLYDETGGFKQRRPGRVRTIRTLELKRKVESRIKRNPIRSIRKMASELNVSKNTVARIVQDIGAKSRAITSRQLVTTKTKEKRLERARKLLSKIRHKPKETHIVFSDEKLFKLDRVINRRNSRYISKERAENVASHVKHAFKTKHPGQVMVLRVFGSDGSICPPIFIDSGIKITSDVYIGILQSKVLPWLRKTYPENNFIWQQDGAPAHSSAKTQKFLREQMPEFWSKELWPPSSPDLNPLDYAIWGHLESKINRTSHSSVKALKSVISREWKKISPSYISNVCKSFRSRLTKVIEKEGDIFE